MLEGLRYRNPLDLGSITIDDLRAGVRAGVVLPEGREKRLFHRAAPAFHDDPDNVGLFRPFKDVEITYPPIFYISEPNARLVGYRTIISREGFFYSDLGQIDERSSIDFSEGLVDNFETTGLVRTGSDIFSFEEASRLTVHLDGTVVVLTSNEPSNYGSFIFRVLPKLLARPAIGERIRYLVYARSESFKQLLALAGVPPENLILHNPGFSYTIEHAILVGLRNPSAFLDAPTREFLLDLASKAEKTPSDRRHIYVSRHDSRQQGASSRRMLNEAELIASLSERGFRIVEPGKLTASEQISIFSQADLVVGPSGSGMFNAAFCRTGATLIDIESEKHWIYAHSGLFASCGLRYGIFEGKAEDPDPAVVHKPWRVNIPALLARIGSLC